MEKESVAYLLCWLFPYDAWEHMAKLKRLGMSYEMGLAEPLIVEHTIDRKRTVALRHNQVHLGF